MRLLFNEGDRVALCTNVSGNWAEQFYTLNDAINYLLANRNTPNLYFRASSFGNGVTTAQDNCSQASALFLDIDYGTEAHKKPSLFKTLDDVTGYLLTMPLLPSIAWHTGHGVQCAFLLDKPCVFPSGGGVDTLDRYKAIGAALKTMAMADDAFTPEHAYRVPISLNSKSHKYPGLADVMGSLLWCEDHIRYTLEQIEAACTGYGIDDLLSAETDPVEPVHSDNDAACDYSSLPQDLRDEIEDTGSERSSRLFSIVGRMVRAGHPDEFIVEAIGHGSDFVNKYGHREGGLKKEVGTCAAKIRQGHYVYSGGNVPPVRVYNTPFPVKLDECGKLSGAMELMPDRYAQAAGITLLQRVRDAVRFHEHLSLVQSSCVVESPCGAGKSVWALCHIGAHASTEGNRYVYVTETVDALYKAADMLAALSEVPVGRLHGFNADRCRALSGNSYTWKQCVRGDRRSRCNDCNAKDSCVYQTRGTQELQPVLCMTHAGFIRALEDGSDLLQDARIIVDEGLSPFDTWSASLDELKRVTGIEGVPPDTVAQLFPYTSLAQEYIVRAHELNVDADVYARRNYVYRNEAETAALADLVAELRTALRTDSALPVFGQDSEYHERTRDTLAALVNFFRPSVRGDASYAYRESRDSSRDKSGYRLTCKRNRFGFDTEGPWKSLHMMNASASLSPFPYPDSMPVFTCPDLPESSNLVTLHCIKANPTKSRLVESVKIGYVPLAVGERTRLHSKVLVCLNKDSSVGDDIEEQVKELCGDSTGVTVLTRGRIKGVNDAGECTLALLQGMALFTGVDDCALHATLQYRRTFPDTPYVYTADGSPNWPGGRMKLPAMRNYYALRSLDEIYQAIWRTAVRNDHPVEAVIVVPDAHWLAALYRTVMPGAVIGSAYVAKNSTETLSVPEGTVAPTLILADGTPVWTGNETGGESIEIKYNFEFDRQLYGMEICAAPPGTEITKSDVAMALGYKGDDPATVTNPKSAWMKNKTSIMALVGNLFEESVSNNRRLRRREPRS